MASSTQSDSATSTRRDSAFLSNAFNFGFDFCEKIFVASKKSDIGARSVRLPTAIARPIPRVAPVTTVTRSFSSILILLRS